MIYYKLFDEFPMFKMEEPDPIKSRIPNDVVIPEDLKSGAVIFFSKELGVKPSLTASQYREFFKDLDKNMMTDLENYDIVLIDKAVKEKDMKGIILKILEERD